MKHTLEYVKQQIQNLKTFSFPYDATKYISRDIVLGLIGEQEKELREPKVSDRIMNWLACNQNLPLKLKVEMIVGLYAKEALGDEAER